VVERKEKVGEREVTADKLWLDLDHGMALRKREFAEKGHLVRRISTANLKEILPGYWLPFECTDELLAPADAPKEHHGKPAVVVRHKVRTCNVNDVKDGFFAIPEGVQVHDRNKDK